MRDMLDAKDGYPLAAWRAQFQRIHIDLDDAFAKESQVAPGNRTPAQSDYLSASVAQFWAALERMFQVAAYDEAEARSQVRLSIEARQAALSTAVSRLLVQNNESEEQAYLRTRRIHEQVERNLYIFLGVMLIGIAAVSVFLIHYNRRVFDRVNALSERRAELAQQLISMQENTFRSISRELHDDFGQVLTAVGAMIQRADKLVSSNPTAMREELREVNQVVQSTLDKIRSLSQALHPLMLEEVGLESSLDAYVPMFERRTGIAVRFTKVGSRGQMSSDSAAHLYRVLQEALNNVARHSGCMSADVRLTSTSDSLTLEIEDHGSGFRARGRAGLGMISMRERVELVGGRIEFVEAEGGGALVRVSIPASSRGAQHVRL